jgi:hypothetical protein
LNAAPQYATPPAGALPQNGTGAEPNKLEPTPDPNVPAQDSPQNKTFEKPPTDNNNNDNNKPAPESRLLLPPAAEPAGSGTNRVLHGLDPEDHDRFTAVPMRQVWAMKPVSSGLNQTAVPVQITPTKQTVRTPSTEANPWRAARQ